MDKLKKFFLFLILIPFIGCEEEAISRIEDRYSLEVSPTSLIFDNSAGRAEFDVTAIKTVATISDGVFVDFKTLDAPYTVTVAGEGFSIEGNNIIVTENEGAERAGTLTVTVDGSNLSETITLTQVSGLELMVVDYSLEVTPETHQFPFYGGSFEFEVNAVKTTTVTTREGEVLSEQMESTPYTTVITGGFTLNGNTASAAEHTGETREGEIVITLDNHELSKTITLSQLGVGYYPTSYTIDGTVLTTWSGSETTIDLSIDPAFDKVTEIATRAFGDKVGSVTLSDNIITVSDLAFNDATSLTEINVSPGNTTFWSTDGVLFRRHPTTNQVVLWRFPRGKNAAGYKMPSETIRVGQYAFQSVSSLVTLEVAEGVTHMDYRAFYTTPSLAFLSLPSTLVNIGNNVFHGATGLKEVRIKNPTPPYVGASNNFYSNVANATLFVPVGSKDAYADHAVWGNFGTIVEE